MIQIVSIQGQPARRRGRGHPRARLEEGDRVRGVVTEQNDVTRILSAPGPFLPCRHQSHQEIATVPDKVEWIGQDLWPSPRAVFVTTRLLLLHLVQGGLGVRDTTTFPWKMWVLESEFLGVQSTCCRPGNPWEGNLEHSNASLPVIGVGASLRVHKNERVARKGRPATWSTVPT